MKAVSVAIEGSTLAVIWGGANCICVGLVAICGGNFKIGYVDSHSLLVLIDLQWESLDLIDVEGQSGCDRDVGG